MVPASADVHTVTRQVTQLSWDGVVRIWGWYSSEGSMLSTAGGNKDCAYLGMGICNFCHCWSMGKASAGWLSQGQISAPQGFLTPSTEEHTCMRLFLCIFLSQAITLRRFFCFSGCIPLKVFLDDLVIFLKLLVLLYEASMLSCTKSINNNKRIFHLLFLQVSLPLDICRECWKANFQIKWQTVPFDKFCLYRSFWRENKNISLPHNFFPQA